MEFRLPLLPLSAPDVPPLPGSNLPNDGARKPKKGLDEREPGWELGLLLLPRRLPELTVSWSLKLLGVDLREISSPTPGAGF